MKFKTVNDLATIDVKDMKIDKVVRSDLKLTFLFSGGIIKAANSNNTRYEDVYCMEMSMDLYQIEFKNFCLQGYRYYDPDGELLEEKPDTVLDENGIVEALKKAEGSTVFEFGPEGDHYTLVYDVPDEDGDIIETYQIDFTCEKSVASWDRFSGPVNGSN